MSLVDESSSQKPDWQSPFYAAMVASSEDAIVGLTLDLIVLTWNPGAEHLYGYAASEVAGQSFTLIVPPEKRAELEQQRDRLRAGTGSVLLETVRRCKDGTKIDVSVRVSQVHDAAGAVIGLCAIARDVSERKRTEAALRQSEMRKATILEVALDCIISIDQAGRIVEFNPAAEATFGYSCDEALGQVMAELIVPPALRGPHYDGFARYLATGEGPVLRRRIELTGLRKDGTEIPIEIAIVPIHSDGSVFFTAYVREITERKRAETENAGLLREVSEAAQRQRAFLRDVLHSVTDGRLHLCAAPEDLPVPLPAVDASIPLSATGGLWELRRRIQDVACAQDFTDARWQDLATAANEAAMNAVVHAGGGRCRVCSDGRETVQVWVEDDGQGISVEHLPRAALEKGYTTAGTLGHGMKMMLQTADAIWLLTGSTGTTVVLEQRRVPEVPAWL